MTRGSVTHYRGYHIEGVKQGGGMLLRVIPTRPNLPILKYSRFRTVRATWDKALGVVTGYIGETLGQAVHTTTAIPSSDPGAEIEEARRIKAQLLAELTQLRAEREPKLIKFPERPRRRSRSKASHF